MKLVNVHKVQTFIDELSGKDVYIHLETTNGAYATHNDTDFFSTGAYIRNAKVKYEQGKIVGTSPYRVGLRLRIGWVYAEGITHFEIDNQNRLLLAGHNHEGKLAVAFQISETAF